ncbi:MAG: asparagine--tRNA ligase [Armatimonadetes bacterium]|nr:asparagine--tRNA ligase [Armatimonadota bacterium]
MDYRRTYLRDLLASSPGEVVSAYGWVKTRRDSKGVHFVQLNDGSCFADFQVVIDVGSLPEAELKKVTTGACVRFDGELVESPGSGQAIEMKATALEVYGPADPESYPLQKKGASFEFLREIAHLRVRGNSFGAVTRVRHRASWAVHKFFQDRGFSWIHTPMITASDAEGAGEMFHVTTALDVEDGKYRLKSDDPADDFFGKPSFLTVSGQLNVESYCLGMTNVYTFSPTFRAENSNTSRHLAEFWMIEPEQAFCDIEGNMNLAEEFVREIVQDCLDNCSDDLDFFNKRIEPKLLETLNHVVKSNFERITYTEAVDMLKASGENFEFPVEWGSDLQSEHERWLTETKIGKPAIVVDYPKQIKAFYMYGNDDGKTVRAMDVLVPRIGELIGGSQREDRLDKLESRIEEMGLPKEAYWWYLDLRRFGSAPHAGFGLGFERLMMYLTGMKNIRDVIPFHRAVGQAEF